MKGDNRELLLGARGWRDSVQPSDGEDAGPAIRALRIGTADGTATGTVTASRTQNTVSTPTSPPCTARRIPRTQPTHRGYRDNAGR
ncbi:hypothetical protein SGLAM104S_02427 [Streptomyces glaucescens]